MQRFKTQFAFANCALSLSLLSNGALLAKGQSRPLAAPDKLFRKSLTKNDGYNTPEHGRLHPKNATATIALHSWAILKGEL